MNPRIYLVVLAGFAINTDNFAIAGILPEVARNFHISPGAAGQLVTVYALTYGFGAPLLATFLAKFSTRHVLLAALCGFSLANAASAFAPTFGLLIGYRILAGACAAIVSPASYALAAALATEARRGQALALVGVGSSAAVIVGLPAGAWIAHMLNWHLIFGLIAGLSAAVVIVSGLSGIPDIAPTQGISLMDRFSLLMQPGLLFALLPTLLWSFAHFIVYTYVVPLLQSSTHLKDVSGLILVLGVGSVVGNWAGGVLVDRIGARRTLVSSLFLLAVALNLLPLLAFLLPVAVVLLFCWGFAVWAAWPALQHRLHQRAPQIAGQMLALNASIDFLGSALGAGVGGLVLGIYAIQTPGWIGGGAAALAALCVLLGSTRSKVI